MIDFLNAFVALSNFVLIPAISYGAQLALGALGVTLIYVAFLKLCPRRHDGLWRHVYDPCDVVVPKLGHLVRAASNRPTRYAVWYIGDYGFGTVHRSLCVQVLS